MPLTNQSKVESHNNLTYEVASKVFEFADEAEEMVRKWIGDSKYDEIAADTSHSFYSKAQKAESLLAYGLALPLLNMRVSEKGGLVKNTGFSESVNDIMSKRELDSYCRNLFARARNLLRKLLLASKIDTRPQYNTVS